jgi:mandelamide amidase
MQPWLQDACALADAIRRGEVRAVDALEASLQAIASSELNAVVHLDADGARRTATDVDARVARGDDPGLSRACRLDDLQDVAGMPTTQGRSSSGTASRSRTAPSSRGCARRAA